MKRISIQRVSISSFGKLVGTWHAIIGLFAGILLAITATITFINTSDTGFFTELFISVGIILGSIILVPLFSYLVGWIYGALIALVLNLVVGTSGGLEIDIEDVKVKA